MKKQNQTLRLFIVSLALSVSTAALSGTSSPPPTTPQESSPWDDIWSLATLFKDDEHPVIQEFKLRGRYHGQYHWLNSDHGDDHGWEDRRSRFGFDAKLFNKQLELRLDAQSTDGFDPIYGGLIDAYVRWKHSENFSLTLGRQKVQIGAYDFIQPSTHYPTFERSQIFNQLKVDRTTGAVAEGRIGQFTWQAGLYSNDIDDELGQFAGGASYGAGIGYDLKETLGLQKALWRLDYLHSDITSDSTTLNKFDHVLSTTFWLRNHRWGFVAEGFAAAGQSADIAGFYLLPIYDLIPDKLQLVGRYTYSAGDGPDSLSLQKRYDSAAPLLTTGGTGDRHHAGYLGLQYFIYGEKLKLLAGVEYTSISGGTGGAYDGWTALTGLRLFF